MINSINFKLFPSNEFQTFAERAIQIAEPLRPSVPALAPFVTRATGSYTVFQEAVTREMKNPMTPVLASADSVCDSAFLAFRLYAEACSYRSTTGWSGAAQKILEVFDKHGYTAYKLGYKAQNAAETNIISELKKNCTAEMTLIGATIWFTEFETALEAFKTVFDQSLASIPKGTPTIVSTRPALVADLKSLFSMIDLLGQNDDAPAELKSAIVLLNNLITTSLASVKAAATREENAKKEEEAKASPTA